MTDSDEGKPPSNRSQPGTSAPAPAGNGSTPHTAGSKEAKKLQRPNPTVNGSSGAPSNNSRSLTVSGAVSNANSPMSSRESSPARPQKRQSTSGVQRGLRPRKSSQDVSPNRTPTPAAVGGNVPSAAAIQRALSTASTTRLLPTSVTESSSRIPRQATQKSTGHSSGENTPHWPVPSRLKSPPPSAPGSRRNSLLSQRKTEPDPVAPNIVVQLSTPPSSSPALVAKNEVGNSDSEQDIPLPMKGSGRGVSGATRTLETVQEASLPTTPGPGFESLNSLHSFDSSILNKGLDDDPTPIAAVNSIEELPETGTQSRGSGSESGGNKSDGKRRHSVQRMTPARPTPSSGSYVTPAPTRSRTGNDSASKNMTIETETVTSIPQAAIGGPGERNATGRSDHSGSIRLKPSNETIRPKKERKKVVRKAPSVNPGTASTKADIFEQKVASAVDEANSSDSDETFVYESNPPEAQPRANRHHSRTSSTTSVASLVDHRGTMRPLTNVLESHRVAGKRSMKFATNPYNDSGPVDAPDRSESAIRSGASRASGGGSVHQHHIGRHGRAGPGHSFDSDSPFSQQSNGRKGPRQLSRPSSPTYKGASLRLAGNGLKKNGEIAAYDIEAELADTERTPLLGTIRTPRTRTPRRPNSASLRQLEYQNQRRRRSWVRRFAACIVITIMVLLLVFGAVGFLFAMTKPLHDIQVVELQNVLASEQELIMDLLVEAVNPNVVAITVTEMNVSVFAKSKYVGTDKWWREHGEHLDMQPVRRRRKRRTLARQAARNEEPLYHSSDSVDEGTDPVEEDPEGDRQTMLIGRLYEFDSALNFDGSPFQHHPHYSVGEVRLTKPGNATEDGGSARWEHVIQHSFELIVRGVLKYELPLSSRKHTASISASTTVIPDTGGGNGDEDDGDVDKGINWHWDQDGIEVTTSSV